MRLFSRMLTLLWCVAVAAGCANSWTDRPEVPATDVPSDNDPMSIEADSHSTTDGECPDAVRLQADKPIHQVSWMMTHADTMDVEYRLRRKTSPQWTPWKPVELTFAEDDAYNARMMFDTPADAVEVRGGERIHDTYFSVQSHAPGRRNLLTPQTAENPEFALRCSDSDVYLVDGAYSAEDGPALPDQLITTRDEWGAVAPNRICRQAVDPYRITFHHTYAPDTAGRTTAAAVRQIQSFHLNERGWCDIGYHFLIGPHGEIFEGSAEPHRLAAHVMDENEGNVGIALIGDFTEEQPRSEQLKAATKLVEWLHTAYDIPLTDSAIRGHGEWPGQTTSCPGDGMSRFTDRVLGRLTPRPPAYGHTR